ncbi:oligosaccharide flippase family protein [Lentzea sp. BCCO 10_0061]|uniref:Oligosaccharide flippase family protein n=1 Tax=Lentzea sokolovensis TaxID=3095429 RepID=A0ABU4UP58_9PSEU|nr:oligosaccharide flippase family protein [Lentzea sp. BCCO 10_0061]MDX8141278.1 oligosaccharide flippase family protein [Lentzea sp. BCCO 10_0061]
MTDVAVRGSLWLFAVNLVSKSSQIVVTLALALFLTEADLGAVALVVSIVNIGQVIQAMGVYDIVSRTARDPLRTAGTVLTMSIAAGVTLTAIIIATADPIATALGAPEAAGMLRLAALTLPFTAAGGVQMALMHRNLDFRRRMLPDAGGMLIGAAVTVTLAAGGTGPTALVLGLLCTAVAQPVLAAVAGARIRPVWDRDAATEATKWLAVVGPGALIAVLLINVDYLAIGHVLGPQAVGGYSLAFRIAWVPYIMIAVVLGGVLFPICAELVRNGQNQDLPATLRRFTIATLTITGGLYVVTALSAHGIVVLGEQWADAAQILVLLCGYGLGLSLLHVWYQVIRAAGHARQYLALEATHLVALLTALVFTTELGPQAVALTQLAVVWLLVPVTWLVLVRNGLAFPLPFRATTSVIGAALACTVISTFLPETRTIAGLVTTGLVLLATYCAITLPLNRTVLIGLKERA